MEFLPIFLRIKGRDCLVVGGGEVAARKAGLLLRAGARVRVVAPVLCDVLQILVEEGKLTHDGREFLPQDLHGCTLVIGATDNQAVNRQIYELASLRHIPVNIVDQPELCSFILPSIVDRSPIVVAVSSGGASPVLARVLRARLETLIPAAY